MLILIAMVIVQAVLVGVASYVSDRDTSTTFSSTMTIVTFIDLILILAI